MKKHSGIFLFHEKKFLVIHRTGKNSIRWSIPKGSVDALENGEDVVVEKLEQLAGITRKNYGRLKYIGEEVNEYGNTALIGYCATIGVDVVSIELKCNYKVTDSQTGDDFDAVDSYMWLGIDDGRKYLPPHQVKLLERIDYAKL
jgi:predicted NUDIX family NTP pyrophosphohydrolase